NRRKRNAAQTVPDCNLQAASVGAREQLGLVLVAAAPDRANRVDNVSCSEVAAGGDDGVADGTASNAPALLIDAWAALGVNGAVRAGALVEPPVCSGYDCIGLLVGDVAGDETQRCLSDHGLGGHSRNIQSRRTKDRHDVSIVARLEQLFLRAA